MRTTLTLQDDVAERLKELAHEQRLSFKEVVDVVLRRGLAAQELQVGEEEPFEVVAFSSPFRAGVDPLRLNQLVDDLEVRRLAGRAE
jgi:hypothetical protein